jgi:molybdopterin-guanine dinucleotide biosynthesis protein A
VCPVVQTLSVAARTVDAYNVRVTDRSSLVAGVVLTGGRSVRMGAAKAGLEWHGSTLLRRAVGVVARGVDGPVVVVRAPGQGLPALPPGVEVVDDPVAARGPLQGILTGLASVAGRAPVALVCAVDMPLLHPAFLRRVARELRADAALDVALPVALGHAHPLAAAYRTAMVPLVAELVDAGRLRAGGLFERARVLHLDEAALLADPVLAAVDPRLDSLRNVNTPEEYREARARPAPGVRVRCYGALATGLDTGPRTVRAATLQAAATAMGVVLDGSVVAVVDEGGGSDSTVSDPETPLVTGDAVAFLPRAELC